MQRCRCCSTQAAADHAVPQHTHGRLVPTPAQRSVAPLCAGMRPRAPAKASPSHLPPPFTAAPQRLPHSELVLAALPRVRIQPCTLEQIYPTQFRTAASALQALQTTLDMRHLTVRATRQPCLDPRLGSGMHSRTKYPPSLPETLSYRACSSDQR